MNQIDQGTKKVLKWYNCSSQLANARWNPDTKDWVYDITYILQVYETPIIDSAYANVTQNIMDHINDIITGIRDKIAKSFLMFKN
jgi:hypothetical protein